MGAVEKVTERLLRSTAALEASGLAYTVIGGNAVAAQIGRVDPGAVRFTQDVDLMVHRADFEAVKKVLTTAGFEYAEVLDVQAFVDGPEGTVRDGIHVLFDNEKVRPDYVAPAPRLDEAEYEALGRYRVVTLEALVRMKLTSYRRKDQVHLQDLIRVGLVDSSWPARFHPVLTARLQELLDDPNG